ncbi:hypothetical protein BGZ98_001167, partial [Dissophora globulifera]
MKSTESDSTSRGLTFMSQRTERGLPVDIEQALASSSPLFRKKYINKPSIVQFLAERVQQESLFKQELLTYIEESKLDKRWSIAAANAITILVKAGVRFNGADLKGIKIPGADL